MNPLRNLVSIAGITILALLAPSGVASAQKPDSPAITQLLEKVRAHADRAEYDAQMLENYTRSRMSWESHGSQLETMRHHVNDLISDTNELTKLRDEGSPWQQQAIDSIDALLPEMAAHLTATIEHYRDNRNRTRMQPYRDLVVANQDFLEHAHNLIVDYVEYGESKAKTEALEQQLGVPDSGEGH